MDLSTFSKETLINMIEDQQKLINEQQKKITSYQQSTQVVIHIKFIMKIRNRWNP
jgi:hypothetical protein